MKHDEPKHLCYNVKILQIRASIKFIKISHNFLQHVVKFHARKKIVHHVNRIKNCKPWNAKNLLTMLLLRHRWGISETCLPPQVAAIKASDNASKLMNALCGCLQKPELPILNIAVEYWNNHRSPSKFYRKKQAQSDELRLNRDKVLPKIFPQSARKKHPLRSQHK